MMATAGSVERASHGMTTRASSPIMIGRGQELRTVTVLADRPASIIFVEGEAGIGKTRLVTELLERLTGRRRLVTCCRKLCEPFPYEVVLQALRKIDLDALESTAPSPLAGALRGHLPELAESLPPEPPRLDDPMAERHRLFRAVAELLGALGPTLLVVEDLHWADDGSRHLLDYLMSDPPANLSLVATYRPEEVPDGLPLGAAHRQTSGNSTTVRLHPLTIGEVGELATAILDGQRVRDAFAKRIHERSAGLPLMIEEILCTLRGSRNEGDTDGMGARRVLDSVEIPSLLREPIVRRVTNLGTPARRIVQAAAVLGVPAATTTLAAVAELPAAEARSALSQTLQAHLLVEACQGRYGFRHVLAQQAVYRMLRGPEREQLHLRALQVLRETEPQPVVQLAEHSRSAGARADWVHFAKAAAEQSVAAGDASTAADILGAVLLEMPLPAAETEELAAKLAHIAPTCLRKQEVIGTLERTLAGHELSASVRGEVRLSLGQMLIRQVGGVEAGRAEIGLSIEDFQRNPRRRAMAMSYLAKPLYGTTPLYEHLRWMDHVDQVVDDADDPAANVALLANTIASRLAIGDRRAWAMVDRMPPGMSGRSECWHLARLYGNLADACSWVGHYRQGRSFLRTGMRLARDMGFSSLLMTMRSTEAHLDWRTGNWAGLADRIYGLRDEYLDLYGVGEETSLVLGLLAVARGEWQRAVECLEVTGIAEPSTSCAPVVMAAHAGLVRLLLGREEHAAAASATDRGLNLVRSKGVWAWAGELAEAGVHTYCRTDRGGQAQELIEEFADGISDRDAPVAQTALLTCWGIVAYWRAELHDAEKLFDDARARYTELSARYSAALCTERLIRCRLELDRRDIATPLVRLTDEFDALGATRDVARCQRLLRETGAFTPSRRGRRGYGTQLSPRERHVAHLLSEGNTNQQIAEVLFLSRRTVEQHVSRVMRKLNISSRGELERMFDARN